MQTAEGGRREMGEAGRKEKGNNMEDAV